MRLRKAAAMVVMLMSVFTILSGCMGTGNKPSDTEAPAPIAVPEGVHITGLVVGSSGMAREPYYIFRETADGTYMKITMDDPEWRNVSADELNGEDKRFYGVDTILDGEDSAVSVRVTDDAPLSEITEAVEKSGALGWDGFEKPSKKGIGAHDGDRYVSMYIVLSDGTTVKMSGSAAPDGFSAFLSDIARIFEKYCKDAENE